PLIAAAIAILVLGRPVRRTVWQLAPWLVLAIPIGIKTMRVQSPDIAGGMPLWFRPIVAADAVAFDVYKIVWPARLAIDYGRSPQALARGSQAYFTWGVAAALLVLGWMLRGHRPRWVVGGLAVFALGLAPTLGLIAFKAQ